MERLTERIDDYAYGKLGVTFDRAVKETEYRRGFFECTAMIERLCEYEETGFTPEQVINMINQHELEVGRWKERVRELIEQLEQVTVKSDDILPSSYKENLKKAFIGRRPT